MKKCCRCGTQKELTEFPKDLRKPDGHSYACKSCKKIERVLKRDSELKRWKRYYAPGTEARKRHIVRSQTRIKFGSAKEQLCSICSQQADEWHHTEYRVDSVIAVCRLCHGKLTN